MSEPRTPTILCLASYFKGEEFLRECKRQGWRVLLVAAKKLADHAWPAESIDEFFWMPDLTRKDDVIRGISYVARLQAIDRIVPLDEFDLETAAGAREHLRIPGMGETTARYFRDKLAMRMRAREEGILVPDFVGVLNHDQIRDFMTRVSAPWLLKPRSAAATIGIRKIAEADELWPILDELGDEQSFHVLEQFVEGDVYHVDSIVSEREILFSIAHRYGKPPMSVAHEGGIFTTHTLARGSPDEKALQKLNRKVLRTLGLVRGVTHAEFIKAPDERGFHFLETAARVGGAHIADLVAAATGLNLWAEWAKIETATAEQPYTLSPHRTEYAGIVISLARQQHPDTSAYDDPEIIWRMEKRHHAGLIVASKDPKRVESLVTSYVPRFQEDFMARLPVPERPTD